MKYECCNRNVYETGDDGEIKIRDGKANLLICGALNDGDAQLNIINGVCGTVKCPFYKPKWNLIRRGDRFFYADGREFVISGGDEK